MAYRNAAGQARFGVRAPLAASQSASTLLTGIYSIWNGDTLGTSLDASIHGAWNGDVQFSSTTLATSLLNVWNANDNTNDSYGTANGTVGGGLTYTAGKFGQAFQFNGSNAYVQLPNSSGQFNFAGNFTISAWINIPNYNVGQSIFVNFSSGGSYGYGIAIYLGTNNTIAFELRNGNNIGQYQTNGGIPTNTFKMVTVVREVGQAPKIYFDGVLSGGYYSLGNSSNTPGFQSNQNVMLGSFNGVSFGNHKQDATMIWGRALTAAEVAQLSSGGEYPYLSSANDSVGTNHGTAQGGLTYTAGKIGNAFQFNGSNAYVSFPTNSWNSLVGTDLTISLWVRFASTANQTLISNMSTPSINVWNGWEIRLVSGQPIFYSWNNTGSTNGVIGSSVTTNTWYHIVATKRGASYKIYMNGSLAATGSGTGDAAVSGTFYPNIGHLQYSSTYHGLYTTSGTIIDSVNLWSKEISTDEVTQLYNSGNGAQYPYSSQTLPSIANQLGVDNGTLMNGCSFTDGKIGKAFTFDGVNDFIQLPNNSMNFTGDFSISAWLYFPTNIQLIGNDNGYILCNWTAVTWATDLAGWNFTTAGNTIYFFTYNGAASTSLSLVTGAGIPALDRNGWRHIVFTRKGTEYKLWLDGGQYTATSTTMTTPKYAGTIIPKIGRAGDSTMGGWDSYNSSKILIDAVNVWQKALTQAEVTELYNSGNGKQLTATPIVTNGLVLNLDASRKSSYPNTGTTWFDISGNSINGTLTNGPIFGTASDGAITFDGVNDFIDFSSKPTLTNKCTIETWCNLEIGISNYRWLLGVEDCYRVLYNNTSIQFVVKTTNNGWYSPNTYIEYLTTSHINNNCQIVAVYNGSRVKLYFNANLVATSSVDISGNINSNSNPYLLMKNGSIATNIDYGKGRIYQNRLYNNALTDSEILQNFNATKSRFGL